MRIGSLSCRLKWMRLLSVAAQWLVVLFFFFWLRGDSQIGIESLMIVTKISPNNQQDNAPWQSVPVKSSVITQESVTDSWLAPFRPALKSKPVVLLIMNGNHTNIL